MYTGASRGEINNRLGFISGGPIYTCAVYYRCLIQASPRVPKDRSTGWPRVITPPGIAGRARSPLESRWGEWHRRTNKQLSVRTLLPITQASVFSNSGHKRIRTHTQHHKTANDMPINRISTVGGGWGGYCVIGYVRSVWHIETHAHGSGYAS